MLSVLTAIFKHGDYITTKYATSELYMKDANPMIRVHIRDGQLFKYMMYWTILYGLISIVLGLFNVYAQLVFLLFALIVVIWNLIMIGIQFVIIVHLNRHLVRYIV